MTTFMYEINQCGCEYTRGGGGGAGEGVILGSSLDVGIDEEVEAISIRGGSIGGGG